MEWDLLCCSMPASAHSASLAFCSAPCPDWLMASTVQALVRMCSGPAEHCCFRWRETANKPNPSLVFARCANTHPLLKDCFFLVVAWVSYVTMPLSVYLSYFKVKAQLKGCLDVRLNVPLDAASPLFFVFVSWIFFSLTTVCAAPRCAFTIITELCRSHVKAVYYASVYCRCLLLYCIYHVLLNVLVEKWGLNDSMYIKSQFSLQWKSHTLMLPLV